MAGRKSKVLFDSIDLEILRTIEEAGKSGSETGVLDLAKAIDLTHSNLKKHLEKLSKARLVIIGQITSGNNRRLVLETPVSLYDKTNGEDITEEEIKDIADYKAFVRLAEKLNEVEFVKETLYEISREMAKEKKKHIDYPKELKRLEKNEAIYKAIKKEKKKAKP